MTDASTPSVLASPPTSRVSLVALGLAALVFCLVVALPHAVRSAYVEVAECEGPSMEPTLREGDVFVVDRYPMREDRGPRGAPT